VRDLDWRHRSFIKEREADRGPLILIAALAGRPEKAGGGGSIPSLATVKIDALRDLKQKPPIREACSGLDSIHLSIT
jgi:hypothetical protein